MDYEKRGAERAQLCVGALRLRTARRAKVPGNLPHVSPALAMSSEPSGYNSPTLNTPGDWRFMR